MNIIPIIIQNKILSEKFMYNAIETYEIGNINKSEYYRLLKYFNSITTPRTEYRIYYKTNNGYKIYKQEDNAEVKYITQQRYFEYSLSLFPIKIFIDKQFPSYIKEVSDETNTYVYNYYTLNDVTVLLISGDHYSFRLFGNVNDYVLQIYLNLYLETDILYTKPEQLEIMKFIRLSLQTTDIDQALVNYEYLDYNDLTTGGLISDSHTYTVLQYIKGPRKLLIFHPLGIWLYDVYKKKLNRISNEQYRVFFGVILDGFIIEKNDYGIGHPETNNWFFAYDCLTYISQNQIGYLGDIGIQNQCHKTRLLACQVIADKFKTIYLHVNTPIVKELSVSQIFARIRETLYRQSTLPFKCRGLMFYLAGKYTKKGVLIWEFKPAVKLLAMNCNKGLKFYVKDNNELVEFNADGFNGLEIKNVDNCNIVEYNGKEAFIYNDKLEPDNMELALQKWNAIKNRIDEETIMGNNRKLFDLYHDRIIDSISTDSVIIHEIPKTVYDKITLIHPTLTEELITYIKSGVKTVSIFCIDKVVAFQAFIPVNGIPIKSFATLFEEYYFHEDHIEIINKETKEKIIEYFFDVEKFINALEPKIYEYHIADQEKLLPDEYLIISQLYSYIIINLI